MHSDYSDARPSLWYYWLSGMGVDKCLTQLLCRPAGSDGGSGGSRKGFLLQSTCSPPPGTPHPPRYSSHSLARPARAPLSPTSVSERTRCRHRGEVPRETGAAAAPAGSPPSTSRTPRTHRQPPQRPRGPGTGPPAPPDPAAAIFGPASLPWSATPPRRRRPPSPRTGGGPSAASPLACITPGPAEDEGSGDRGDVPSWPMSAAGQLT